MLAYLDAGTFNALGIALAGGVAGVAVFLKMYWNRILGVFSKNRRRQAEIAQGELLGIEIDPETGQPVDPEAAAARLEQMKDDQSTIGDRS